MHTRDEHIFNVRSKSLDVVNEKNVTIIPICKKRSDVTYLHSKQVAEKYPAGNSEIRCDGLSNGVRWNSRVTD